MSHINEKLGLTPARKRSMMKLPTNRAEAAALTSARCPDCQRTGVRASKVKGAGWLFCSWCHATWQLVEGGQP